MTMPIDDVPLPLNLEPEEDEYPVHPAAQAFRMLAEDELQALAYDIAEKGLFDPIMLDAAGEMLIDGRNRLKACRLAGVEPRFERLPPSVDPIGYVVSKNIARRDLTKGQKAIALAILYPQPVRGRGNVDPAKAQIDAAKKDGGSPSFSYDLLNDARKIVPYPDLVDVVRLGTKPFSDALNEAKRRQQAATSEEAQLARLQAEVPDVAALVVEGTLTLAAGLAELDERARKRRVAIEQGQDAAEDIVPTFVGHVAAMITACEIGEPVTLDKDQKHQLREAFALLKKRGII
jgi:hypothetical protein